MAAEAPKVFRTTLQLFRDCIRLADYLGTKGANGNALKRHVRNEFKKHMFESNPEKIEQLRENAFRGLQNYLMYEAQSPDPGAPAQPART
eukprot:tig00020564_g11408.t1